MMMSHFKSVSSYLCLVSSSHMTYPHCSGNLDVALETGHCEVNSVGGTGGWGNTRGVGP